MYFCAFLCRRLSGWIRDDGDFSLRVTSIEIFQLQMSAAVCDGGNEAKGNSSLLLQHQPAARRREMLVI